MAILNLNRCRQCGGYMYFDADRYGYYAECLQCHYRVKLEVMVEPDGKLVKMDGKLARGQTQKSPSS